MDDAAGPRHIFFAAVLVGAVLALMAGAYNLG